MAATVVNATLPNSASVPIVGENGRVTDPWYNFFQNLFLRTGGATGDASLILDTIGSEQGGMLARFTDQWNEFVASAPNQIPVMNHLADVDLKTITQLLDFIGSTAGKTLFRGATEWQIGPLISTNVVAAGTNQGNATVLTSHWNEIVTVAVNSGVILFPVGAGSENVIYNDDVSEALKVYPPVGSQIDSLGINNPYSLASLKSQIFRQLTATQWRSTQLG